MPKRLAYFLTHPIQYQVPMIRSLVQNGVPINVLYGCDPAAEGHIDPGFERPITWDIPMLEGYEHQVLSNTHEMPAGRAARFRAYGKRIKQALQNRSHSAAWVHGWGNSYPAVPHYSLAAINAARHAGLPILMRAETHLQCLRGNPLRRMIHRTILRIIFARVSAFLAVGTANAAFYKAYGVPDDRVFQMPYTVDNGFFQHRCLEASRTREQFRRELSLPENAPVVLFCGRLAPEKQPETLLRAMEKLSIGRAEKPVLLFVGDGPLRAELESRADNSNANVRFCGFRNQTELPAFYDLCDVFALPSDFEPWGLVVNEVMNAAKPVIVSDRVGSGADLVKQGVNGGIFRTGEVDALCSLLQPLLDDKNKRLRAGNESLEIINRWSFNEDLAGLRAAMKSLHLESDD